LSVTGSSKQQLPALGLFDVTVAHAGRRNVECVRGAPTNSSASVLPGNSPN
jgi:hypothetical protein